VVRVGEDLVGIRGMEAWRHGGMDWLVVWYDMAWAGVVWWRGLERWVVR
jgi:hypothetical protein